jgi:hypothetical protein
MSFYWGFLPQQLAELNDESAFIAWHVIEREELELADHVAPSTTHCFVVQPSAPTIGYGDLFRPPWSESRGRYNCYVAYFDDIRVFVSMEGNYWMIEASYPHKRRSPTLLAAKELLVVTQSPMAAAQIAQMCAPHAIGAFEWLSYYGDRQAVLAAPV